MQFLPMVDVQAWRGGIAGNCRIRALFAVALGVCSAQHHGGASAGSCKQGTGMDRWLIRKNPLAM